MSYYLPGGKLEQGEEPTAAVRELAEELGVVPTSLRHFAEVTEWLRSSGCRCR